MSQSSDGSVRSVLIIAGELSADTYAARLVPFLKEESPSTVIYGIGQQQLQACADQFVFDTRALSTIGLWESFQARRQLKLCLNALRELLRSRRIHRAVIIDFPHHNFKLAAVLQAFNVPIVTFITPNFWVWGDTKSAQRLIAYSRDVVCIFPKEKQFYEQLGAQRVHYFGHPLAYDIPDREPVIDLTHLHVGIMPGSRPQELKYYLPTILNSMTVLRKKYPHLKVTIIRSANQSDADIQAYLTDFQQVDIPIVSNPSSDFFNQLTVVICGAGTTTTELMLRRVPMVVLGAVSPITYFIGTVLLRVKVPFCAMPNILCGKRIVPELMQKAITVSELLAVTQLFLTDTKLHTLTQLTYESLRNQLKPFNNHPIKLLAKLII